MALNGKIRSLLGAAWTKFVSGFKFVIDPPPGWLGWYILAVLAIAVGGNVIWAKLKGSADKPVAGPVYLVPRMPSVVTTTLPPPAASPKEPAPLKLYAPKKTVKRKKKCDAVFC